MSGEGQPIKKIISFKSSASNADIEKTEEDIKKLGGTITGKTLITGKKLMFTLPPGTINTFAADEHVDSVEDDAIVTTQ